jgi:cell division protein FtsI (penicillin-binding protein 3)
LLSLFAGRLVQLQGIDASRYAEAAKEHGRTVKPLPADRGEIFDRNGVSLAGTAESYDVVVDQTLVKNPAEYAIQLADLLDLDAADLQRDLTGDDQFKYVAKGVTGADWRQVQSLKLAGLYAESTTARTYPAGAVGGNVIGFVGAEGTGLAGFELAHDQQLSGVDGEAIFQTSPRGQRIPNDPGASVSDPQPGTGYRLTIDTDLQWFAEQAVADAVQTAGADYGVATVMSVDTAEVLAMAATPVVDPNQPSDTDQADLKNKAVENAYEPGSVFKPITMSAILEEGLAGPETVFSVPGRIERSGENIGDYWDHGTENMTLTEIVARSSNVGSLLAAENLKWRTHHDYLTAFGFGSSPELGLPGESSGRVPGLGDWSQLTQDTIAFGQGVSASSVQMASAYATIANGGVRVEPTMVASMIAPDGTELPAAEQASTRVVSEDTAGTVTEMMEAVMGPDGTGSPAAVEGYRVAGKTGTAQRVDPECGCYRGYNSSFMGFAPADDPKYVVVVSLINPTNGNSGGALAGPAFADIMRFTLQQGGVSPSVSEE